MAVAAIAVMAVRWWASVDGRYPRVVADETAYLGMARLLAGGEPWDLGLASTYGPGYALLLVPWFALDFEPDAIYRAAVFTNIALAGALAVTLEALVRRLPGMTRPTSAAIAGVAATLPALTATTNLAWSDNLAPLVFVILVLAADRLVRSPGPLSAAMVVGTVVFGYLVHGRFLLLAPVVIAMLVVLSAGSRLRPWVAAAATATTIAGLGLVQLAQEALYSRLYDPQQVTQGLNEAERITKVGPLLTSAAGQAWYLLSTTAGVAGLGALLVGGASTKALRRTWSAGSGWRSRSSWGDRICALAASDSPDDPTDPTASSPAPLLPLGLAAMIGAAFVTSVVFMTDRPRGDHLVYGRYNDLFVAPLVVIGLAALTQARHRVRAAAALLAAAAIAGGLAAVVWSAGRDALEAGYLVYPVLGLVAIEPLGPAELPAITGVAIALTVVIAAASLLPGRARPVVVVALTTGLCLVGTQRAVERIDPSLHTDIRGVAYLDGVLEPGVRVGWVVDDPSNPSQSEFYSYQLYMPRNRSVRLVREPWTRGETYLMAGARLLGPAEHGYRLAWVDPGSTIGLWVAPGPEQERLEQDGRLLRADGFNPPPDGDQGRVRWIERPRIDGNRLRARVEIRRTGGDPWPTAAPGGDPLGRIRVGVMAEGQQCGCQLIDARADIGTWLAGDLRVRTVEIDLAIGLEALAEPLAVQVQLLREGTARFGTGDAAPVA